MDDQPIQHEVILGVDTHRDVNVGAVINHTGKLLGALATAASASGYLALLAWARSLGCVRRVGVEGTGTYGAALARVLRGQGIEVLEVNRPNRSKRRLKGKSDPTDAENAARAVLAGEATAIPIYRRVRNYLPTTVRDARSGQSVLASLGVQADEGWLAQR